MWWLSPSLVVCLLGEGPNQLMSLSAHRLSLKEALCWQLVARVPVLQIYTYTGDRREEWQCSDCPTAYSTDTSACLTRFWTKYALLDCDYIRLKWSELQPKRKKDGASRKRKFVDFVGQSGVCCSVLEEERGEEKKRLQQLEGPGQRKPAYASTHFGFVLYVLFSVSVFHVIEFFSR